MLKLPGLNSGHYYGLLKKNPETNPPQNLQALSQTDWTQVHTWFQTLIWPFYLLYIFGGMAKKCGFLTV